MLILHANGRSLSSARDHAKQCRAATSVRSSFGAARAMALSVVAVTLRRLIFFPGFTYAFSPPRSPEWLCYDSGHAGRERGPLSPATPVSQALTVGPAPRGNIAYDQIKAYDSDGKRQPIAHVQPRSGFGDQPAPGHVAFDAAGNWYFGCGISR